MGQLGPPNKGPNLGLQKSALWRHMAAKTPPKMGPNLGFEIMIYRVQVGLRFGRVLEPRASQDRFLRPNLAPCWPHVSSQHEPMLDFQHGLMLRVNMASC